MAEPQKSSKKELRFTERELTVMVDEIVRVEPKIFGALIARTTVSEKNEIWSGILSKVNAVSETTRTVDKIKRRWHDLKTRVKKLYSDHQASTQRTGAASPPSPLHLHSWEEKVLRIIPVEALTGVGGIDSAVDTRPTSHSQNPPDEEEETVQDEGGDTTGDTTAYDPGEPSLQQDPHSNVTLDIRAPGSLETRSPPPSVSGTEGDSNTTFVLNLEAIDLEVVPAARITEQPRSQSRARRDRQTAQREEAQPLEHNVERDVDDDAMHHLLTSYGQFHEESDQLLHEVKGIRQAQDTMNDNLAQINYGIGKIEDVLREIAQNLVRAQAAVPTPSQTSAGPPGDSQRVPIPAPASAPPQIIRKSSRQKRNQEEEDVDLPTASKRSRN